MLNKFNQAWKTMESEFEEPTEINYIKTYDYKEFDELARNSNLQQAKTIVESSLLSDAFALKNVIDKNKCNQIIDDWLNKISNTKPSFHKMYDNCPNFHRI